MKAQNQSDRFAPGEMVEDLHTLGDFVRYATSKFNEHGLFFGHGTDNAMDEAIFMAFEHLHLPVDRADSFWMARLTMAERRSLAALIEDRIVSRKPAAYLLNKAYIHGHPFYVDENVLVPRSFIADILMNAEGFSQMPDYNTVSSVLDLCTGSGCLAVIAAHLFPNAAIDACDLSPAALAVAKRNVDDYGLTERISLFEGDLFDAVKGRRYDLIISNPPYVDREGMESLPPEYRHEPAVALAAGNDGLDIVHRILNGASDHMSSKGGLLCELGRCGPALEAAYPETPFLWVDTDAVQGEVFWLSANRLNALGKPMVNMASAAPVKPL